MKLKIYAVLTCIIFLFSNCNDVLDRPSLTSAEDAAYWTSESRVPTLSIPTSLWAMEWVMKPLMLPTPIIPLMMMR